MNKKMQKKKNKGKGDKGVKYVKQRSTYIKAVQ
jgi:hypothetical protein